MCNIFPRTLLLTLGILFAQPHIPASAQTATGRQGPTVAELSARAKAAGLVRMSEVGAGTLLLKTDIPGAYAEAPLLASDYKIDITGPLLRATVTQRFTNASDVHVEGVYAFPLPDNSAVDTLRLRIGERFIEGEIKEKKEAREIFEQARSAGHRASLVEQQRPNLFTNEVTNIGPGETVIVQIGYQEALSVRNGVFSMRLPLVVAPRYNPRPEVIQTVEFGTEGWSVPDPVPDREQISSPILDPRLADPAAIHNPVDLSINLDAGFPIGDLASTYHSVNITRDGQNRAMISLDGAAPADKDFELVWNADEISTPSAAFFTERHGEMDYALLMITPPKAEAITERPPREVIFVQDVSGSMDGTSIKQAREGLEMAIKRLRPEDQFNIIFFNNEFTKLSPTMLPASRGNIREALRAVRALKASGGTEMFGALEEALKDQTPDADTLRQVVFLTDGAVGDEARLLALIEAELGRTRLFTVGIGSAPNGYFMTRAAEMGRGAHIFIGDLSEVSLKMQSLFAKIETPAIRSIHALWPEDVEAEMWPAILPDLYAGDPLVMTVRAPRLKGELNLTGIREGGDWGAKIPLSSGAKRTGIAKLWARSKIRSLEAMGLNHTLSQAEKEQIDAEVLHTALGAHLTSRLTSLVAVDKTPNRPDDAPLTRAQIALNLPEGWNPAVFFVDETDHRLQERAPVPPAVREAQLRHLHAADTERRLAASQGRFQGASLPAGATNWKVLALIGLLLSLIGLLLMQGRALRNSFGRERR